MNNMERKKAVIYARQSFGPEENSLSIESQLVQCRQWCNRNNVEVIAECSDNNTSSELYDASEEGRAYSRIDKAWIEWHKTQKTANRRVYRKGLADAFSFLNTADYFIVNERTRFFRNPSPLSYLANYCMFKLQEKSVSLVEVETNKIDAFSSKIDIAIQQMLATYEMEKIAEKREQSIRSRKRNTSNGIIFSNAFATKWQNKKIHFDREKSKVIRYVFDSILNGKTYAEILYTMNTKFLSLAEGKCFYESSIYNIIQNAVYCGYKKHENTLIKIQNLADSPIVSLIEFKQANELVKIKKNTSGKQKYNIKDKTKRHFLPFSGLLYCGSCGSRLSMIDDHGIVYFCKKTLLLKNKSCSPIRIRTNFHKNIDDFLLVFQPLFLIKLFEKMAKIDNAKKSSETENELTAEITNLETRIKSITEIYLKSGIELELAKPNLILAQKELTEKKERLSEYRATQKIDDERFLSELKKIAETIQYSTYRLDDDTYSILLRETVKKVTVYAERIEVTLFDGNSFTLPRILGKHKSKSLPIPYIELENNLIWRIKYQTGTKKILVETEDYIISTF